MTTGRREVEVAAVAATVAAFGLLPCRRPNDGDALFERPDRSST